MHSPLALTPPGLTAPGFWHSLRGRWRSAWHTHALYLCGAPQAQSTLQPEADALAVALADPAVQAFGRWCAQHAGQACTVSLPSRSVLTCVGHIGQDDQALRQQAQQQWQHYDDVDEAALDAHWVLRQVNQADLALVCALPRALLEALREQALQHGVSLRALGPWWTHGVQAWLASRQLRAEVGRAPADPVQGSAWLHTLRLQEPGLVTQVQALQSPGARAQLHRVWSEAPQALAEAHPAALQLGSALALSLPALPAPAHLAALPADADLIWWHDALAPWLRGQSHAWMEPA